MNAAQMTACSKADGFISGKCNICFKEDGVFIPILGLDGKELTVQGTIGAFDYIEDDYFTSLWPDLQSLDLYLIPKEPQIILIKDTKYAMLLNDQAR